MSELLEALTELERQMDVFPRVILDERQFRCLRDATTGSNDWDYQTIYHQHRAGWTYSIRLGHAEILRDHVKHHIGERVANQLTGSTK